MGKKTNISEIIFVTGEQKNVGKTTFLKHLLLEARDKNQKIIVTSIGVDGERRDQIYASEKPEIFLENEEMVITTEDAIKNASASFQIIDVFDNDKYIKKERPVLAKVIRSGNVELISAGTNFILSDILISVDNLVNSDIVFIDGAVDRITQIASVKKAGFYYVIKIDNNNFFSSIDNIKRLYFLSNLSKMMNEDCFEIKGALTKNKISNIPQDAENIVVDDFTKVFLNYSEIKLLTKKYKMFVKNNYELKALVAITNGVDKEQILKSFDNTPIKEKIIFNPYERG